MPQKKFLITLSTPIAIRTIDGTKLVNVVEATEHQLFKDLHRLRVSRWYNSHTQLMCETQPVDVEVKASNIRSRQEVV